MPMTTKPMTPLDAAWYHIDGPVNLAMVTAILLTKEPLDFPRVKKVFADRLRTFERFGQRVVEASFPGGRPYWEDVPHFEFGQQMHHVALPAPHNKAALIELINGLASTPLDRARPLWEVHVVDDVEGGGGLILRFHHCIGDGTAMMAVAQEVFDSTPNAPIERGSVVAVHPEAGLLDKLLGPALQAVDWSTRTVTSTWESVSQAVRHPEQFLEQAGAVRAIELGNAFGLVLLELAVGSKDPLERLRITKANMDALKGSPEAMIIMTLFNIFGRGPKLLEDLAVDLFGRKASLVMTNVVGPRETVYLAGVPIDRTIFWVPHPGKQLGMGISIFSYRGAASLAVISDAHLVPDPEVITAQFNREFEKMLAMVRPVRAKQRRPVRERRRPGTKQAR